MRESTVASITNRIIKAVTRAVAAVAQGADAVFEGVLPAPQPVPVRVRARRN